MHELSIASSIMEGVLSFAEQHRVSKILKVRLAIGELTCVELDQLRFCYGAVTAESSIEESTLEIERVSALVSCPHCAYHGAPKYWEDALLDARIATLQCPQCGKSAEATQGHECAIRNIQYVA